MLYTQCHLNDAAHEKVFFLELVLYFHLKLEVNIKHPKCTHTVNFFSNRHHTAESQDSDVHDTVRVT